MNDCGNRCGVCLRFPPPGTERPQELLLSYCLILNIDTKNIGTTRCSNLKHRVGVPLQLLHGVPICIILCARTIKNPPCGGASSAYAFCLNGAKVRKIIEICKRFDVLDAFFFKNRYVLASKERKTTMFALFWRSRDMRSDGSSIQNVRFLRCGGRGSQKFPKARQKIMFCF